MRTLDINKFMVETKETIEKIDKTLKEHEEIMNNFSKGFEFMSDHLKKRTVNISRPIAAPYRNAVPRSVKHSNFVDEPIGDKGVTCIPGIGEAARLSFRGKGIDKAIQIFAEYLRLKDMGDEFSKWLKGFGIRGNFIPLIIEALHVKWQQDL